MMRTSRYISTILGMLCVAPTLVSLVLTIHSFWLKHEMLERLENEQLHRIVLKLDDVHWQEKGTELKINGQLFDVKYYHEENGKLVCWGIFDQEETELANWVENNSEKNEDELILSKLLIQLLKLPYIDAEFSIKSNPSASIANLFCDIRCILPIDPFLQGNTIPPNCFLV